MADPKAFITIPTQGQALVEATIDGQRYYLVPDQVWMQFFEQMQKRINDHETRIAALEP